MLGDAKIWTPKTSLAHSDTVLFQTPLGGRGRMLSNIWRKRVAENEIVADNGRGGAPSVL